MKKIKQYYDRWKKFKYSFKETKPSFFFILDWTETLLVALFFALLIRKYIIQTSVVPTSSMVPTMMVGDRLFVNKFIYRFSLPKRGDIVVFKSPHKDKKEFVKRCIGLPGETLSIERGIVYINGEQIIIPGVNFNRDFSYFDSITIPENNYFMMGDNRPNSSDSRYWGFVPTDDLLGEALFTFWPLNRIQVLR